MKNIKQKKDDIINLTAEIKECGEPLIGLNGHGFVLEPVYFKKNGWGEKEMYLRSGVVKKLEEIQLSLPTGYKFKIFDAYRSIKTQKKIYDAYKNELRVKRPELNEKELDNSTQEFVVFPKLTKEAPPRHNTGGAVDLTIVNEKGEELNMGTVFDHFGPEASPEYFFEQNNFQGISSEQIEEIKNNRNLLEAVMCQAGFSVYPYEWWHWEKGTRFNAALLGEKYAIYGSADLLN